MTDIATSTVAQQAFRELGLRPLSSYADDSPEAVVAKQVYATARDMVLESYDWSFARQTITPPAMATPPDNDDTLPHAFVLPAATLAVRHVSAANWRREQNLVRSDTTPITVRLTLRETIEANIPATVRQAMAYQMAVLMAPSYAPTRAKRRDLEDALMRALGQARVNDQLTASPQQLDGRDPRNADDWPGRVTL